MPAPRVHEIRPNEPAGMFPCGLLSFVRFSSLNICASISALIRSVMKARSNAAVMEELYQHNWNNRSGETFPTNLERSAMTLQQIVLPKCAAQAPNTSFSGEA